MGLASNRQKQRISEDPNNLAWSNDKSKVGFVMLKKMGWSEGKGLGQTQSGLTRHIKVSRKECNAGIGVQSNAGDNWLQSTSDYAKLLADLNTQASIAQHPPEPVVPSLCEPIQMHPRYAARAKHLRHKRMATNSECALTEILGAGQHQHCNTSSSVVQVKSFETKGTCNPSASLHVSSPASNNPLMAMFVAGKSLGGSIPPPPTTASESTQPAVVKDGDTDGKKKSKKVKRSREKWEGGELSRNPEPHPLTIPNAVQVLSADSNTRKPKKSKKDKKNRS